MAMRGGGKLLLALRIQAAEFPGHRSRVRYPCRTMALISVRCFARIDPQLITVNRD
jgi:hypothetical protein